MWAPDVTYAEVLRAAAETLGPGTAAQAEAERLLEAALREATGHLPARVELYARAREEVEPAVAERVLAWARARAGGATLQHLTRMQTFLGHEYEVGPEVLVPRPETETLVAAAFERLEDPRLGFEVGLGSGVISIELLAHWPGLSVVASEVSLPAAARARSNAGRVLGKTADRLAVVTPGSALEVVESFRGVAAGEVDFVVSNPPYLTRADVAKGHVDEEVVRNEPALALFAPEEDPLYFYRGLERLGRGALRPGGWLFAELHPERAAEALALFANPGHWADARILPDLAGRDRVLAVRRPARLVC